MTKAKQKPLVVAPNGHVTVGGKSFGPGKEITVEISQEQRDFLIKSKQVVTDEGNETAQADT